MDMVKDFEFYKFNLCSDIEKNTEFLRDFMNNLEKRERKTITEDKIYLDITFDFANILNSETGIIYSMNKFATNVFENLKRGVSYEAVKEALKQFESENENVLRDFDLFTEALEAKGITLPAPVNGASAEINAEFAKEDNYRLSFVEHAEEEFRELVKVKEINKENKNELCVK